MKYIFLWKKKKDIKNLEFARFRESKIQSDRTYTFYLKRIHQVTSRHQKIRVDENQVGGTYFVYLYVFP